MKRHPTCRTSSRARVQVLSLATLGLLGTAGVSFADSSHASTANASCTQETRRVAVWPVSPKALQMARFEERAVTVCDGKVTKQSPAVVRQAKE
jgi:hypothetical protein